MSRLQLNPSGVREFVLVRADRACPECGAKIHIRCCRTRNTDALQGLVRLMVKLVQYRNQQCDEARTFRRNRSASMPCLAGGSAGTCSAGSANERRLDTLDCDLAEKVHDFLGGVSGATEACTSHRAPALVKVLFGDIELKWRV